MRIEDIKEIEKSKEFIQLESNSISKYFTYIISILLILVIIWSLIAKKTIVTTAVGEINQNEDINVVSNLINGEVACVEVKDGENIKKGQIILSLDCEQYKLQKDILIDMLNKKNNNKEGLNILKSSIEDNTNYFDSNDNKYSNYYNEYLIYLNNVENINSNSNLQNNQQGYITDRINNLELLNNAIDTNINYFTEGSEYYYEFNIYENNMNKYNALIQEYNNKIIELKSETEENNKSAIDDLYSKIKEVETEKKNYTNSEKLNISQMINDCNNSLLDVNIIESEESYKREFINNIDTNIEEVDTKISEIQMSLNEVNQVIDNSTIKSNSDGVVSLNKELYVGDYLVEGDKICKITKDKSKFKVKIYINNSDIGEIEEKSKVKIEVISFPSTEYGYLETKIDDISVDSKTSETSENYYIATCTLNDKYIMGKNNKKGKLKSGMAVKVRIINREVSYFTYFMDKIDIIES